MRTTTQIREYYLGKNDTKVVKLILLALTLVMADVVLVLQDPHSTIAGIIAGIGIMVVSRALYLLIRTLIAIVNNN